MSSRHFDINRPVHLARRDVFFEKAIELLNNPLQNIPPAERLAHIEVILSLLRTAQRHAFFALQASGSNPKEQDFLRFLRLIQDNVQSLHSMIAHQLHLQEDESFLCQFLSTTAEQCVRPAQDYQRREEDLFHGLWNILRLAHGAYRSLQEANIQALSPEEHARYNQAYESFREDVARFRPPPASPPAATVSAAPA